MGVRVYTAGFSTGHIWPHATDWYVSDERVLQIYQPHDGDVEFVIAEYNKGSWAEVEYDPPLEPDPQPEPRQENEKEDK